MVMVKNAIHFRDRIERRDWKGFGLKNNLTGNQELPYEKFLALGAEALTEAELIAIILRTGTKDCPALKMAQKVLSLAKGKEPRLNGLHHISLEELMEIPGIGEVKAVKIKCIAELAVRMACERAAASVRFNYPDTVAAYYMEKLRHERREQVLLLMLDNRNCLLREELLSIGTVTVSLLSPREVFVMALREKAVHIMLLHNHPSGNPTPSMDDIEVTESIKKIGQMIDIPLIDHIIIGDNKYMSFKEAGLL